MIILTRILKAFYAAWQARELISRLFLFCASGAKYCLYSG